MGRIVRHGKKAQVVAEGPAWVGITSDLPLRLAIHASGGRIVYEVELDPNDLAVLAKRAAAALAQEQ
jgi:hypothetical protein